MSMKTTLEWQTITEPNLHGEQATIGNRSIEVVRAYANEWLAFYRIDGKIVQRANLAQPWKDQDKFATKAAAKKEATKWLLSESKS